MAEEAQLNPLSCTRCKDRKVRCPRTLPQCSRCLDHGVQCVYVPRAKRRSQSSVQQQGRVDSSPSTTGSNDALNTILERLQRLEKNQAAPESLSNSSPDGLTPDSPDQASSAASVDAVAVLTNALNHMSRLFTRQVSSSMVTSPVELPLELAKIWIENYFNNVAPDAFLNFVNKRLIRLVPEMLAFPHVHLDSSLVLLYYAILYHGCILTTRDTPHATETDYVGACYVACRRALPQWRQDATGTPIDFVAALLMTMIASQNFDYELCWDCRQLTAEFAKTLDLCNFDCEDYMHREAASFHGPDDHRRGFWQLVQTDLFVRALTNRPLLIPASAWNVKLPWLSVDSEHPPEGVKAIAFLISSRITFVLARFFALIDGLSDHDRQSLPAKTEELCIEITDLFTEWEVDASTALSSADQDNWPLLDCLLTGYTSIICMQRKIDTLDSDGPYEICTDSHMPSSPTVLDASRKLLRVYGVILDRHPNVGIVSGLFGAYAAQIALARVYTEIRKSRDAALDAEDLEALQHLTRHLSGISQHRREIYPMVRALTSLCEGLQRRTDGGRFPSSTG